MLIILIVWNVLLLPTYFLIKTQMEALQIELDNLTLFGLSQDRNQLLDEIGQIRFKLNSLKGDDVIVSNLLREITNRQLRSIKINVIDFKKIDEGNIIELQGIANNRESLVELGNLIEESSYFESVDLPLSSFSKNIDIPFLLKINIAETKDE